MENLEVETAAAANLASSTPALEASTEAGPDKEWTFSQALESWWSAVQTVWSYAAPYVTTPVLLVFLLPLLMCLLVYVSGVGLYFYHRGQRVLRRLREAVEDRDIYKASREVIATFWDIQGWIWFGYEVEGLENVPAEGPAMIIYYHGALPVDYYYFVAKVIQHRGRVMHSVVDRFLFKLWGLRTFLKAFHCTPGSQESCTEELNNGHLIGLSPGGVFEAQFGDEKYDVMWKERVGFAKIGKPKLPHMGHYERMAAIGSDFLRMLLWG